MKIQGHLQDYPLPVLLEVLADRRESGCLRIAFEPEPAILHFKEGQLVDARISLLRGSAAINLALTMEKAPFDFDNEIILPHSVIDNQERAILSRLLGMQLSVEEDEDSETENRVKVEGDGQTETSRLLKEGEAESKPPNPSEIRFADAPTTSGVDSVSTIGANQVLAMMRQRGLRPRSDLFELLQLRPVFRYLSRPNLIRTAAVILVLAVPAAVGIVRISRRSATAPTNAASRQPKAQPEPEPTTPSSNSTADSNPTPVAFVEPAHAKPAASPANESSVDRAGSKVSEPTKTVGESESSKVISEVTKVKEEAGLVPDSPNNPSSRPESRLGWTTKTIVVEVQIEQGRVTGAWVRNSRKGLEAFEAAALRIIRQRRYSKESKGTDSVAVDVTVNQ